MPTFQNDLPITGILRAVVVASIFSTSSHAGGLPGSDWMPSAIDVGGIATVAPKFEGSRQYRVQGFPIVLPSGFGGTASGLVQFRGVDDIRIRALSIDGFELGPVVGWRFGRDEDDGQRLRGLGDVEGGLVAGAHVGYRFGMIKPFAAYLRQVTGDDTSGLLRFGVESDVPLAQGIAMRVVVGANYADKDYMSSYFAVSAAQSARSAAGLAAYSAGAGIKDAFVGVSTDLPIATNWTLRLSGRYSRLVGDAANSPIVETESQFSGGIGLTYRFGLPR